MIRNTAREIAVHLAYELSFTDKTVKELLDERLTKEYFDTLKDEDNIYEKAPGAAQTEYIRSIVSGVAEHAPELDGYIAKYAKAGALTAPTRRLGDHARCDVRIALPQRHSDARGRQRGRGDRQEV